MNLNPPVNLAPREALARLRDGNARFVGRSARAERSWRPDLVEGQRPFAVVLGCADSRAPAEYLFDQGLGDLFVIRVAGNIVAPSLIGSVEFAVSQFGTRLVVVLGHTHCGAIAATTAEIERGEQAGTGNLAAITSRIRPHIESTLRAHAGEDRATRQRRAARANVVGSVAQMRRGSPLIEKVVESGWLAVVGAEYGLETGVVDFFAPGAADAIGSSEPAASREARPSDDVTEAP